MAIHTASERRTNAAPCIQKKTPLKKVQKDVRFLKRAIEIKQIDTTSFIGGAVGSFVGSNSNVHVVNMVVPGNSYTQRVGNKIAMKDLKVRLHFTWRLGPHYDYNNTAPNGLRTIVVYDKYSSQANGQGVPTTTPSFNTIFQDRDSNGTTLQTWLSGKNHDMGDRFVVLYDKVRQTPPVVNPLINESPVPDQPASVGIPIGEEFTVQLKGRQTCFNVNEITEGALYLIIIAMHNWSMSGDSQEDHYVISNATCRLRYYDI